MTQPPGNDRGCARKMALNPAQNLPEIPSKIHDEIFKLNQSFLP